MSQCLCFFFVVVLFHYCADLVITEVFQPIFLGAGRALQSCTRPTRLKGAKIQGRGWNSRVVKGPGPRGGVVHP